jgi:hypothetical protein
MSSDLNATAASMLGILARGPMSGWELYASFEDTIGHFWSLTRSQVYRELQTLAERGLIEIEEHIRFPLLLTTFFGDSVPREVLRETCRVHRIAHAARLADYEAQLEQARAHAPFPALALEFGIAYERTILTWIDGLPWMSGPTS